MTAPLLLLALLLLADPLGAETTLSITSPPAGEAAFSEVAVEATPSDPAAVVRVVFFVDGRRAGEAARAPFRVTVDLGVDNVAHTFRAVATTLTGASVEATLQTPAIQIDQAVTFELRQLYVTVTDDGHRVLDLGQESFTVEDNGKPQELHAFGRGDMPLAAVVLLDASVSMHGPRLEAAVRGAQAFFSGMRGLDEGRLVVYADRTVLATPFTNVPELLTAGLGGLSSRGGTALADHLLMALQQLDERQGRRVVVLLSDGVDSHSVVPMEQVLARARQGQTLIYWIRLHDQPGDAELPALYSSWHDPKWYREQLATLEQAVRDSGGRIEVAHEPSQVEGAFSAIMRELREQYVLGYYPSASRHDGSWHKVRVEVARPGLKVHGREGYVDR